LFVAAEDAEKTVAVAEKVGIAAYNAGRVESGEKSVVIEPLGITFTNADMHLRA